MLTKSVFVSSTGNGIPMNKHISATGSEKAAKNPYICEYIAYIREFYVSYFILNYFLTGKAAPLSNFLATFFK